MAGEATAPTTQKTDTSHSAAVTASVKAEPTSIGHGISINPWHFCTIPGIIKLVQLLIAIICMGCGSPVIINYAHFFMFVVVTYFLFTLILCFAYFINFKTLIPNQPWLTIELIYNASACLFYVLAAVVMLAMTTVARNAIALKFVNYYDGYVAAGVFGLFNFVAYTLGGLLLFREWRESRQQPATTPAN